MKPGASLSLRRPEKPRVEPDLARLKALDEWTKAPIVEQQVAVEKPAQGEEIAPSDAPHTLAVGSGQGTGQGAGSGPVAAPAAPVYPWQSEGIGGTRPVNFRIPAMLFLQLKWLGDTTYGETMTSIILKAVSDEVDRRLKERGIDA